MLDHGLFSSAWAELQWGSCRLGDVRRTRRAVALGTSLARSPGMSLPAQTGGWASLKAAYRLLSSPGVSREELCRPHWEATRASAREPGLGAVLFVQDGSELDYSSHPSTRGLGPIGGGGGSGLELHTALAALGGSGRVLGLAWQTAWARQATGRIRREKRADRRARRTEYDVWGDALEAVGHAPDPGSGTRWVSVGDRGGDLYAHLARAFALGWDVLVRSHFDRRLEGEPKEAPRLWKRLRGAPAGASRTLALRARPGRPAREASLSLAWGEWTLRVPDGVEGRPVRVWGVRVWEPGPPEGAPPLEWLLVTSVPVEGPEAALEVVGWYELRWLVEEYHKCLKTGCAVESRQVSGERGLRALLGFLGIVAVLLLSMKQGGGGEPAGLPPEAAAALEALSGESPPDARSALRAIARLGGFLARKGDGEPGWQTVWKGWARLQDLALGFRLATNEERCG